MGRKLTTEEFIEKATKVHGNKYDYTEAVYEASSKHLKIICPQHGSFLQRPNGHLSAGTGCAVCHLTKPSVLRTSTEDFLKQAEQVHGFKYNYSKVVYETARDKVTIGCNTHGDFLQTPDAHLAGRGCQKCSWKNERFLHSKENFVSRAKDTHGDKYLYEDAVYLGANRNLIITCRQHGNFKATPSNHTRGTGCPSCMLSGYRPNLSGSLYVLVCRNITKIGITNRPVSRRVSEVSKSSNLAFKLAYEQLFTEGKTPAAFERILLNNLKTRYKQPTESYDGSTECFLDVDVEDLLRSIKVLNIENKTQLTTKEITCST